MRAIYTITILLFFLLWGALVYFIPESMNLVRLYQDKLQLPLFTGFLTVGGFLLTLKTFILIKLKEDLYCHDGYLDRLDNARLINPALTRYGPLRRLGSFLVYGVAGALITAFSQFTIGFYEHKVASAFCIAFAIITAGLVLAAWWLIRKNLHDWFDLLEDEERERGKPSDSAKQ